MDKNKLNNYELIASIHTVQIDSENIPVTVAGDERFIKSRSTIRQGTGEFISYNTINPHNYGAGELLSYSRYEDVMAELTKQIELHSYVYSRIDLRLDSYKDNYQDYFKLNSLLIGLFTIPYRFKNDEPTISAGQRTRSKCGVYVKSQYMSVDYYDKRKESQDRYPCKARLEFRELRVAGKKPVEVVNLWFKRLDKLANQYNQFQDKCNNSLLKYYQKWLEQNRPKHSTKSMLTAFIRENQEVLFSMRQLENFCRMCGVENPASRAKNIKQTCGIECFSHSDIRGYIEKIKNSITQYIEQ